MKRNTRTVRAAFFATLLISSLVIQTLPFSVRAEEPPIEPAVTEPVIETVDPAPVTQEPEAPVVQQPANEPAVAEPAPEQQLFMSAETVDPIHITLEVYTGTETLYSGPVEVMPCAPRDNDTASISAYCALEEAGLDTTWSWWGDSAFLDTAEGIGNGSGSENYWTWFSDGDPGYTGLNEHVLEDGETILVTIDRMPTRLFVASTSPAIGQSVEAIVEGFDAIAFAYAPLAGASLAGVTATVTDAGGVTTFTVPSTEQVHVHAFKDGYLDSDSITIEAYEPEVLEAEIILEVHTATTTLYSGALDVPACKPRTDDEAKITAYCALEAAGIPATWSWWGDSAFLNTAGGIGNGSGSDNYWLWFSDNEPGYVGLNEHELVSGEKLVITIDRTPLRLSVATTTPTISEPMQVTVEGFDAMAFAFTPLAGASLAGVTASTTDVAGHTYVTATTTTPLSVYAYKEGFLSSDGVLLTPVATSTGSTNPGGQPGGGTGDPEESAFDTAAAFAYLASLEEDGFVINELVTDWSAIAFAVSGAPRSTRSAIASHLQSESFDLETPSDYIRHAMAMLALGLNPYTDGPEDVVTPIVESFDGTQLGERAYINDDIFALFPLLEAGYTKDDQLIKDIVAFLVDEQSANGSWENGIDLTAAAVQALRPVSSLPGVAGALDEAEEFLRDSQDNDGGFGDVFATAWAAQAIEALGDSAGSWAKGEHTPLTYLAALQQENGGLTTPANTTANSAWATAYAIPAVEGATWYDLMDSVSKPARTGTPTSSENDEEEVAEEATEGEVLGVEDVAPEPLAEAFTYEAPKETQAPHVAKTDAQAQEVPTAEEAPVEEAPAPTQTAAAGDAEGASWLLNVLSSFWNGIVSFLKGLFS